MSKAIVALVLLVAAAASCASAQTLLDVLNSKGYTTLVAAASQFPDVYTFLNSSTGTVFAPTNAAFEAVGTLPTGEPLRQLLLYHVSATVAASGALSNGLLISSLQKPASLSNNSQVLQVAIVGADFFINNAQVIQPNLNASTPGLGYVHGINAVLIQPADIVTIAVATPDLSTLVAAVTAAGLADALQGPSLTVFAPTNAAFNDLGPIVPYLLLPGSLAELQSVLTYHVLGAVVYAANVPTTPTAVTTLNGQTVTVLNNAGAVTVTDNSGNPASNVVLGNVIASNGVVHVVDSVLVPSSFVFSLDKMLLGLGLTAVYNAIERAGLLPAINGTTQLTILAPTNAAFLAAFPNWDTIPTTDLANALLLHVIPGRFEANQFTNGQLLSSLLTLPSLNNQSQVVQVTVNGTDVWFQTSALVVIANERASNGIVHVINQALLAPADIVTIAVATPILSTLVAAVTAAGLVDALQGPSLTVFAPTNDAFNKLGPIVPYLLLPSSITELQSILTYHVNSIIFYAGDIPGFPTYLTMLNGEDVIFQNNAGAVTVTDGYGTVSNVVLGNVIASNGVVHVIDSVLVPTSFVFTLDKLLQGLGLSILYQAIVRAGLLGAITGSQLTILAPTNDAFLAAFPNWDTIPTADLANALLLHVFAGSVNSSSLSNGQLLPSLLTLASLGNQPQVVDVTINANGVFFQTSAQVTIADQFAANGVVHVINKALLAPADIPTIVTGAPAYSTLLAAVVQAGLVSALQGPSLTVFGPDNTAFNALPPGTLSYLLLNEAQATADLTNILTYHVVGAVVYAANVPTTETEVATLNGQNIRVKRTGSAVTVNAANVNLANVIAANGVIHGIDAVLVPPTGVTLTSDKILKGLGANTLLAALARVGLSSILNQTNTIFAPTDAAFAALGDVSTLDDATLTNILTLHVTSTLVEEDGTYTNVAGSSLELSDGKVTVAGSKVTATVVTVSASSNGKIYVIDTVLAAPSGLTTGAIIGIALGAFAVVVVIIVLVVYSRRRDGYTEIRKEPLLTKA